MAPSAVLLIGAWRLRNWAVPGLFIGAFGLALLRGTLGGPPTDAWKFGGFLFKFLALRLGFLLKSGTTESSLGSLTGIPSQVPSLEKSADIVNKQI